MKGPRMKKRRKFRQKKKKQKLLYDMVRKPPVRPSLIFDPEKGGTYKRSKHKKELRDETSAYALSRTQTPHVPPLARDACGLSICMG